MNTLINNIRTFVGLSQQELADKLGVTFATINRWENAKAIGLAIHIVTGIFIKMSLAQKYTAKPTLKQ